MLFDPGSTFNTVTENLTFLEGMLGDGSSPVTFCKMLPYAETDIERGLRAEGRLKVVAARNTTTSITLLSIASTCTWPCASPPGSAIMTGYSILPDGPGIISPSIKSISPVCACMALEQDIREIIASSNRFFVDSAREMRDLVRHGNPSAEAPVLKQLQSQITQKHADYCTALTTALENIEGLGRRR